MKQENPVSLGAEIKHFLFLASLNKVMLIGNLTADPETRQTINGRTCANFTLAINSTNSDGQTSTSFIDISSWDRTAEAAAKFLRKGRSVFVEGRIRQETWQDKQTGKQRSRLRIMAENIQFLGGGQQGNQGNRGNGYESPQY